MGNPTEIDLGGNTLIVKEIKTGATTSGTTAGTSAATTAVGTATLTVTRAAHLGRTILLNGAPSTVVLPASTGSGDVYRFIVTVTGNHVIKVANSNDTFVGVLAMLMDGTTIAGGVAGSTDDTLTFNSTTTGGIAGTWIEVEDVVANKWYIRGLVAGSGIQTAPGFSAGV